MMAKTHAVGNWMHRMKVAELTGQPMHKRQKHNPIFEYIDRGKRGVQIVFDDGVERKIMGIISQREYQQIFNI